MIKHILKDFKNADSNEIYIINHEYLKNILDSIIDNYNNIISYYNTLMKHYYIKKDSTIPEAVNINIKSDNKKEEIKEEKINPELKTETKPEPKHEHIEEKEITKYYKNAENKYLEYKNEYNKKIFKCLKCNYVFNRIDNLQNHFNRQIKCDEDIKFKMIQEIKKNNDNPIIKIVEVENYEINSNYTYYEKYDEEKDKIIYYCNNCDYQTDNLNTLKKHYIKRKIKCYNEQKEKEIEFIYKNNTGKECKYYKLSNNAYKCDLCEYIGSKYSIIRHLDRQIKCYVDTILKEDGNIKYYIEYKNKSKTFKCFHCNHISKNQQNMYRHLTESKNKCYEL